MISLTEYAENVRLPHIYRAEVVENVDPTNIGRVKVRIPAVAPTDVIIWARPMSLFGFKDKTFGTHCVPPVGSYVYVFFENGDPSFPVYFGGVVLLETTLQENTLDGSSEKEFVLLRTPNGSYIKISDNKNKISLHTPGQRELHIDDSTQTIQIRTPTRSITLDDSQSKVIVECSGEVYVHSTGKTIVKAEGTIELDGGSGGPIGVVQGNCKCVVTGAPHVNISKTVKASY